MTSFAKKFQAVTLALLIPLTSVLTVAQRPNPHGTPTLGSYYGQERSSQRRLDLNYWRGLLDLPTDILGRGRSAPWALPGIDEALGGHTSRGFSTQALPGCDLTFEPTPVNPRPTRAVGRGHRN